MTISSSLNAGVAGLNANATRLATIADNIANSGTYGYKRADADFESMVITQSANSGTYSAGGVRANTLRLIEERGALVSTSNAMDMAISGRGMLPVIQETSIGSTTGNDALLMTRTGSFKTDPSGVLKTDTGLVLLGWPATADGTIPTMSRDSIAQLEPVVIAANQTAADPTTRISLGVNLPAEETRDGASGDALTVSVEYFGNLGTSETLTVSYYPEMPASGGSPTNNWTMVIKDSASANRVVGIYEMQFSDARSGGGTLLDLSGATPPGAPAVNPLSTFTDADGNVFNVDPYGTGTIASPTYSSATGTVTLAVAGKASNTVELTLGKPGSANAMTQVSGDFAQTGITKDGSPVGNLTSVEIDDGGYIRATYDTGFTRVIYQVPLVDVPNYNGLTALNNQTFAISPDSGSFYLWNAGDGPTGDVVGYAREGSTTDVAEELTNLIQTQRAYSSNAKIIQTVDEMLQETTNIKR
ncbi:flagellar hook-basal body complex protein [Cereibacter sphaeroides]|uniref:flagellar hook protein FlgE n=1 Tax=Rhodobacterales TaxID=204455 RepID=UPI000BBE2B58|nr:MULTISPECIES: flagellar hook-basal body complex protein [Paracoccaceae]MCE6952353.1 flagellar hook-basal body complex protein [Cereibacter sphaeroides]MCE6960952.1 flagellar hook-basal body complex protein [Cereibacter sphaeroides]MCE6969750.1 flagellar hook-basal body complex protein [Cereibacter sphaeroides]MCE6975225.1 flagellar hook-basal body complex protein [Cereibacter sphaeroides]